MPVTPGERVVVDEAAEEVAGVGVDADIGELRGSGGAVGCGVAWESSVVITSTLLESW